MSQFATASLTLNNKGEDNAVATATALCHGSSLYLKREAGWVSMLKARKSSRSFTFGFIKILASLPKEKYITST